MQKLSAKKISILGLVLMGASALTAAVVPSKEVKEDQGDDNGRLLQLSATVNGPNAVLSCATASSPFQCTKTVGSTVNSTTGSGLTNSYVGVNLTDQTVGNTSDTRAVAGDQTSDVQ